jgi:hypothetical protein
MKYECPITCHSKDMANVILQVFADRQTGQKLSAPDLSIRGHKKLSSWAVTPSKIIGYSSPYNMHTCTL